MPKGRKQARPTLALTVMVRQNAEGLRRALESMGCGSPNPICDRVVVGVDARTDDDSREVAKKLGADVFDFEFHDDFAEIRNELFARARKTKARWLMWIDADDVVANAKGIVPIIAAIEQDERPIIAVQMVYYYARDEITGGWGLYHTRVRIVNADVEAPWVNRVHEVMMLPGLDYPGMRHPGVLQTADVSIEHNRTREDQKLDPDRNLRILNAAIRDDEEAGNPVNAQNLYHLGLEAVARGQWANAIKTFRLYVPLSNFKEQIYDALVEMGTSFRQLIDQRLRANLDVRGMVHEAYHAYMRAIEIHDDWPDAWFGLASIKLMGNEPDAALRFIERGRMLGQTTMNPMVAVQPLRITLDPMVTELNALQRLGDLEKGLERSQVAMESFGRHETVKALRQQFVSWKARETRGRGAMALAEPLDDAGKAKLWDAVDVDVRDVATVRDTFMPSVMAHHHKGDKERRIVIICAEALEPWGPPSIDIGGIGGSETAVVHVARGFAARGYEVEVYNNAGGYEGVHDGVLYAQSKRWDATEPSALTIVSRVPIMGKERDKLETDQMWLWMHDLHYREDFTPEMVKGFDRILTLSRFHRDYVQRCYPWMPDEKLFQTRNGIDLSRFDTKQPVERQRRRCVYLSAPDRGLAELLSVWPEIRQAFDDAELHVFYGWNTWDALARRTSSGAEMIAQKEYFLTQMAKLEPLGVINHGRIGQAQLAVELLKSDLWLHPTAFLETSCISAQECQAAGVVGVSTACGALPETLGDRGVLLPEGWPGNHTYQNLFTNTVINLMTDEAHVETRQKEAAAMGVALEAFDGVALPRDTVLQPKREAGLRYAQKFSWDGVVDQWEGWMDNGD